MIVSIDATLRVILLVVSVPSAHSLTVLPLAPIAITTGFLAILLSAAKGLQVTAHLVQGSSKSLEPELDLAESGLISSLHRKEAGARSTALVPDASSDVS